jgi:ParB-like nuclease domain
MPSLRKNTNWPADRVERWPLAKLVPNARNARTHSDEQVTQLAASIEEWGWTIPVLVDEAGCIIAGHGRVLAAHRLGIEDVPVMVAAGWSEDKKRAYMLADNKLTLNSEWDLDRLAIEIAELRASDFTISLIGFNESEIDELLRADEGGVQSGAGSLAERFMVPPFSVLNARGGWWQERKAAWLALGIQSELGRGETAGAKLAMSETAKHQRATAEPGGSKMPAADYGKTHARGDGRGRAIDPQG